MEGQTTNCCARLSACALGLAMGVLSAVFVLVIALLAHFMQYGQEWVSLASSLYIGFSVSPVGILIGVLWAFVEGYVLGFLLACLYNFVVKRCSCKCCRPPA